MSGDHEIMYLGKQNNIHRLSSSNGYRRSQGFLDAKAGKPCRYKDELYVEGYNIAQQIKRSRDTEFEKTDM